MGQMNTARQLRRGLTTAMGAIGILSYKKVAKLAGVAELTVRNLDGGTKVETLIKIAAGLDDPEGKRCRVSDLVAEVESRRRKLAKAKP